MPHVSSALDCDNYARAKNIHRQKPQPYILEMQSLAAQIYRNFFATL